MSLVHGDVTCISPIMLIFAIKLKLNLNRTILPLSQNSQSTVTYYKIGFFQYNYKDNNSNVEKQKQLTHKVFNEKLKSCRKTISPGPV